MIEDYVYQSGEVYRPPERPRPAPAPPPRQPYVRGSAKARLMAAAERRRQREAAERGEGS